MLQKKITKERNPNYSFEVDAIYSFSKYLIIFISIGIFLINIILNQNNLFYYCIFSILNFLILFYSIDVKSSFTTKFTIFFFYLGFWFKFSINRLNNFINLDKVGDFKFGIEEIDRVLLISSFSMLAVFLPSLLLYFKKLIFNFHNQEQNIKKFYKKNRKILIFLMIFFLLFFSLTNYYLKIYNQIYTPGLDNEILIYFYKWLLIFGLSIGLSYILFFEENKNFFILFLIFETLAVSLSTYSRIAIIKIVNYFTGFIDLEKDLGNKIKFKTIIIFFSSLILFLFLTQLINNLRQYDRVYINYEKNNKTVTETKFDFVKKNFTEDRQFSDIFYNRFLGIDGIMSVDSSSNKNFQQFKNSWKSSDLYEYTSFYEKYYLKINTNDNEIFKKNNLISQNSPGIVGFLYYSGSYIFIFVFCFFIFLFIEIFEKILRSIFNNQLFISIIIFNLIYRVFHFGFAPSNFYKFFLSIILSCLILIVINNSIKRLIK